MEWFRMYSDMPNDPKVGTLTDEEFRTWVELLCLAGKEGNCGSTGVTKEQAIWVLRRNILCNVSSLFQRGLIHYENGTEKIVISKWTKRQMPSDNSTARVRKHRKKKKGNVSETLQERGCNAPEKIRKEYKDIVASVIHHLNTATGKAYKHDGADHFKHIAARLAEGYTEDQLKTVIQNQVRVWRGTPMEQYLRPSTLFVPSKIDGYLNNNPVAQSLSPDEIFRNKYGGL